MMDLTKLADALEEISNSESNLRQDERDSCAEAARILRAAASVDVAGLMELAEAMANAAYASAVDYINGAGADATKEVEARAALESALRMALAAREGTPPNTAGGAFFQQCTAFTAPKGTP